MEKCTIFIGADHAAWELKNKLIAKYPDLNWEDLGTHSAERVDYPDYANKVAAKIRELGMFTFVRWNYIFVAPPLIINKEQVDEGLDIISQAISIADQHCN